MAWPVSSTRRIRFVFGIVPIAFRTSLPTGHRLSARFVRLEWLTVHLRPLPSCYPTLQESLAATMPSIKGNVANVVGKS